MNTSLTPMTIVIGTCAVAIMVLFITYLAIFVLNYDVNRKEKEIILSEITPETLKEAGKKAEKIRIPANALTPEQRRRLREMGAVTASTDDFLLKAGMLYLLYETLFDNDDAKTNEILSNQEETYTSDINSSTDDTDANEQTTDIFQSQEENIEQSNDSLDYVPSLDDNNAANDWDSRSESSWDYADDSWDSDW
ncbi:hypothetical protein SAMN06265339_0693 [Desulfurobacterium pacificum]|uniref:Uncharacterized protein n=1 Tax=Desulfurobacterium pacificum TaxID=240166 RepID=A0ABY1NHA2_9BACT|nr:hypothetical protein [Desulfurobacterium pacificum]SMP09096.1 hypothetical protein SAMN06265339_0693 [Desulfurobacterium pacificum]